MAKQDVPPACSVKARIPRPVPAGLPGDRMELIRTFATKWVNGTVLHYWFQGGPAAQQQAVRTAFTEWKNLGIGLEFLEVQDRSESEVRIAFDQNDGSWSYVGTDVLSIGMAQATMNFGWDLTTDYGRTTALHEIGHTLGMPHEHQNPFTGIVWDEPMVYRYFGGTPNFWSRDQTFNNVLRKIDAAEVEGSNWDPDSVMEYWFPAGLIVQPAKYHEGLRPPGGLSPADKEWILKFYPTLENGFARLEPFVSVPLTLGPGDQANFRIEPSGSKTYTIGTFGTADAVLVLFEEVDGQLRFLAGDDDSGEDRNAQVSVKLFQNRKYVVRVRLYWSGGSGTTAVMYW